MTFGAPQLRRSTGSSLASRRPASVKHHDAGRLNADRDAREPENGSSPQGRPRGVRWGSIMIAMGRGASASGQPDVLPDLQGAPTHPSSTRDQVGFDDGRNSDLGAGPRITLQGATVVTRCNDDTAPPGPACVRDRHSSGGGAEPQWPPHLPWSRQRARCIRCDGGATSARTRERARMRGTGPVASSAAPVRHRPSSEASNRGYVELVGAAGFEPTTTSPPDWCATRLRHAPTEGRV